MAAIDEIELVRRVQNQLTGPGAPFELTEIELGDGQRVKAYRNAFATLPALIDAARAHGDKPFMAYGDDHWSFARFFEAVDALAARLQNDLGVQPGDRIVIATRNRPEWAVAFMAAASIGAVPAPINSFGLRDELLAGVALVEPKVAFLDADRLARIGDAIQSLACRVVLVDGKATTASAQGPVLDFDALAAPDGVPAVQPVALAPQDPALILFTSGASSSAKAVLSSQRAVCQALFNIDYIGSFAAMTSPDLIAAMMQRGFAPTTLTAVPLFHVSGLHAQLLASMRAGRRLVFIHRWEPSAALELIRAERITQFNGAPSMVMQLMSQPGFDDPAVTGSLGGLGFGGASMPQRLIDDVLERRADSICGTGFGLTESNGVGAALSGELFRRRPRSSGLLSPVIEARIADIDGAPLPAGESGEIWLRGVTLMQGYWRDPESTAGALRDGWFRTGDIGYLDDAGYLVVVDRIKDVINRSGEKIAAAEVESCLLQHPQVSEAAVFARSDDVTGEAVVAVVVTAPGAELSRDSIRAHVAGRLAAYKVPTDVHLRDEPLPRNPAGKMLKTNLKREYAR